MATLGFEHEFLCPLCGYIEKLEFEIRSDCMPFDKKTGVRTMDIDFRLRCPKCDSAMYVLDPLLGDAMVSLGKRRILTVSHCSVEHEDMTDDEFVRSTTIKTVDGSYQQFDGPHIVLREPSREVQRIFENIFGKMSSYCYTGISIVKLIPYADTIRSRIFAEYGRETDNIYTKEELEEASRNFAIGFIVQFQYPLKTNDQLTPYLIRMLRNTCKLACRYLTVAINTALLDIMDHSFDSKVASKEEIASEGITFCSNWRTHEYQFPVQ